MIDDGDIKEFLNREGMRCIGVAGIRTLSQVPAEFSPPFIVKDAASVVCYGVPVPWGVLYADHYSLELYWRYCTMLYKFLDMASNKLCLFLEAKGHQATPVYGCYPMKISKREYWGLLPLVYWAEEAGLGRITKCGLLAHPEYGTRIIFGGVITTAPLAPSDRIEQGPCPPDCRECITACPVNAIDQSGKVNHEACMRYANASPAFAHIIHNKTVRESFAMDTILNTVAVDEHATYSCIECLKVCPLNKHP